MNEQTDSVQSGNFAVTRTFMTGAAPSADQVAVLQQALQDLDGILEVKLQAGSRRATIRYDASRSGFSGIAALFTASGCPLAENWWSRLKWSWFRYLDTNAKTNAGTLGGSCCSRPTDIYASREHKR